MKDFLPINKEDMRKRGWEQLDFVFVSGDSYIDHPSFGVAIIARVLDAAGYRVGIISQPDWKNKDSITALGKPRLAFLISGGNIDSMVNHYTVAKKRRTTDSYTAGGKTGKRPDRATIVYGNLIRQVYKDVPIILGGIEASLRRFAHYDYWDNKIRRSILLDSQADIIVYGMGEKAIIEIAENLEADIPISEITYITGTVFKTRDLERLYDFKMLPNFEQITKEKQEYGKSFMIQTAETHFVKGHPIVEEYQHNVYVVQNPPMRPVTEDEFDIYYGYDYMREPHYIYKEKVPAIDEVKYSIISNRGCFGNCSFCAITYHQGRIIQARSHESILKEAKLITQDKDFKGYIHDVGGPTANFRKPACKKQLKQGPCQDRDCLGVDPCKALEVDHKDYLKLLTRLRNLEGIKKVFVRSGIRFDYLLYDKDETFFNELVKHHISGQLKVAPEHVSNRVLEYMGKPFHDVYEAFCKKYKALNKKYNLNQYVVPYLMSSHPGSTIEDAIKLAEYLRDEGINPQQVQDFYPTPSTISTVMYYTGVDPRTNKKVYTAKNPHEKAMQRALIQYRNPRNYNLVKEALIIAGRKDLIGFTKNCLIRPDSYINNNKNSDYDSKKTKKNWRKKK